MELNETQIGGIILNENTKTGGIILSENTNRRNYSKRKHKQAELF
jgi:hypothetical protein